MKMSNEDETFANGWIWGYITGTVLAILVMSMNKNN